VAKGIFTLSSFHIFCFKFQGILVLKDFDIQREAGGVSYRAVQKQFRSEVKENYLEVHLFWAGKGTCCIPSQGTYGPLIQAINAIPGKSSNVDLSQHIIFSLEKILIL
jgi:hypothetical protein